MHIHLLDLKRLKSSRKEPIHANRYLFVGRVAGGRSLPSQPARNTCSPRSRESRWDRLRSPGARVFEFRNEWAATERSTVAVSAYGAVFERELAGRGCRVFLRAAEGIRASPDGRSKGPVSKRNRTAVRSTRIFSLVAAPSRLRHTSHRYLRTTEP